MWVLSVVAGNETTTNLMANMGIEVLGARPDTWAEVVADPSSMASFVEESLRWTSPVQGLYRNTLGEVEVAGTTIPDDAKVFLCYTKPGSATSGTGPTPTSSASTATPRRRSTPTASAFASGIHLCLGAHLAATRSHRHVRRTGAAHGLVRTDRRCRVGSQPVDPWCAATPRAADACLNMSAGLNMSVASTSTRPAAPNGARR